MKNKCNQLRFLIRLFGMRFGIYHPIDFVEFLSCSDRDIRWDAADTLSVIGDKTVVEPVFELLQKEPDMMVAKKLVWAIERGRAWDKLFILMDFPEDNIRSWAASAIAGSKQKQFVIPLLSRMKEYETKDYSYYRNCWLALRGIVDDSSVQPIMNLLSEAASNMMKGNLYHLLGYTKSPQVFDILAAELDNSDEKFRLEIVSGLVALGKEDARALNMLQKILLDPSKHISTLARVAIEYNGG